jgi:hypothetical protein
MKEVIVAYWRHCPGTCLEGQKKATEELGMADVSGKIQSKHLPNNSKSFTGTLTHSVLVYFRTSSQLLCLYGENKEMVMNCKFRGILKESSWPVRRHNPKIRF